jgi:hypothetical protein
MNHSDSSLLRRLARWVERVFSLFLVIGILGFIGSIIYAAYTLVAPEPPQLTHKIEIEIDPMTHSISPENGPPLSVELRHVQAQIKLPPENRSLRVLDTVLNLVKIVFGVVIVFQLRQFLRSIRTNHPFVPANAKRLRCIAWFILAASLWQFVSKIILATQVSDSFPGLNSNLTLQLDPGPVLILIVILIIAEVFNFGVKMKQEQDLTV